MEPVTHILTGAVLARTGLNRRAAYATGAMAIAAYFPDIDVIPGYILGPVAGLQHHRGITHTFVGVPFEAAILTLCVYAVHRLRKQPQRKAPANWTWLYFGTLLALLSHLLLDWTNNYGLRPFFPFNPHWYAGSFVFIFEPVLFLILVAALVLPSLFGLINSEVGVRRAAFAGRGWSCAALVAIAALYVFRFNEHAKALQIARDNAPADTTRVFASPYMVNPFHWAAIADSPASYQLLDINTHVGLTDPPAPSDTLIKPPETPAIAFARPTRLGRVYLDWSSYPVITETADLTDPNHPLTRVTFTDARFLYKTFLFDPHSGRTPLGGTVLLDMSAPPSDRLIETTMGSRTQR